MPKLFTESECVSSFEAVTGHPLRALPVVKTESAQSLAVPVGSGQEGCTNSRWVFEVPRAGTFSVLANSYGEAEAKAYHAIGCLPADKLLVLVGWEQL